MASSRPIAAGETYTPNDINNLRADVLDPTGGHKHDGADGARVPFANLDVTGAAGSTAPPGGSKSYNDIANHVAANQGAHGLNALAHVIGALTPSWLIQTGQVPCVISSPSPGSSTLVGDVIFANTGVAFSGVPVVLLQEGGGSGFLTSTSVLSVTATEFRWQGHVAGGSGMAYINWVAIGPKA
jgi:hypothetical protein